jgi:CTP synthase (UTP-ammonia lyase)
MNPIIGLVGEHRDTVIAHRAIPRALELARAATRTRVTWEWIRTDEIDPDSNPPALKRSRVTLAEFAAIWAVPATPYASMEGRACGHPFRPRNRPALSSAPAAASSMRSSRLPAMSAACAPRTTPRPIPAAPNWWSRRWPVRWLKKTGVITFTPGSRLHAIFGGRTATEGYQCSYGPNPAWRESLRSRRPVISPVGTRRARCAPAN